MYQNFIKFQDQKAVLLPKRPYSRSILLVDSIEGKPQEREDIQSEK